MKKEIANFKKVTDDYLKTVDLELFYVEMGTEYTNSFGDIGEGFYYSMVSMFQKVVEECEKDEEVFQHFKDRLYAVVVNSDGIGWGYHDALEEIYYSICWLFDDDDEEYI
ncbi:hypothetical protein D8M06_10870 [Oceanobacillus halophilus]|uniref:Uncharacterized protein n=2 Tax=Oceanobacillus halophilus TaxID=930130 RepID=A0A495A1F2_9BACI|nr:hypothetical protein D8M06_10870 [Oceanobacillus halophilus]